jgi:hypothetical protein
MRELTGRDPAAEWRGRYDSEDGAYGFVAACGGLIKTWEHGARSIDLIRTRRPRQGAVGIVRHRAVRGELIGAVCVGYRQWVAVSHTGGLWGLKATALAAWEERA